jgi:hypothetical protein
MAVETLDAVADRGYYDGEEIRACEESSIIVTLPKPMTHNHDFIVAIGKLPPTAAAIEAQDRSPQV